LLPVREREMRESGYGLLLRTVAASLEESDPDAAQSLHRISPEVERFAAVTTAAEAFIRHAEGLQTALGSRWYALVDALGSPPSLASSEEGDDA
jgi:hypothetical protein